MRGTSEGGYRRPARTSSDPGSRTRAGFGGNSLAGLGAACRDWDAGDQLGSVSAPTLVVVGEEDFMREPAEALAAAIAGADLVVVPKAGHMLPIEQPDALAEAVAGFLREIGR